MSVTVVHAADLHIDSPLRGLPRYDGAPLDIVRGATRNAFVELVNLCREREAGLLVLAGDLFDGSWRDFNTGLFFVAQLARLREVGCRVVMLRGNHDAESVVEKNLPLPDFVHELLTKKPEVVRFPALGVSVTGQGFANRSVSADLAAGYPDADPHEFSIAMLHTSLDGREGHDSYAPSKLSTLLDKGYDYWALGHVHAREDVHESVVFPGNLQGRHARETGPKGAMVLQIDSGRLLHRELVPLDVVRWEHLQVDVSDAESHADVIDLTVAQLEHAHDLADRTLAARITLVGRPDVPMQRDPERSLAELRARMLGRSVYVEKLVVHTRDRASEAHPLAPFLAAAAAELAPDVARILDELPGDLADDVRTLIGDEPRLLQDALQAVSERLDD